MEFAALAVISLIGLGFAGLAAYLGAKNGSLFAITKSLGRSLNDSEQSHGITRAEFEGHQLRTKAQLEALRDEITDLQDLLDTCSDPDVLRSRLAGLLQTASRGGDPGSD